jgi:upstream activation factor subunit UAF30
MTKQSKATTTKAEIKAVTAAPTPVVEAPVVTEVKVKKTKKTEKVAEPVVEVPAPVVEEVQEEVVVKRRQVTRENVEEDFTALLKQIDDEIEVCRKSEDKSKAKGVRFLRSVSKQVRQLRSDSLRVASKKVRRAVTSTGSGNSGFMKPVNVSREMREFAGLKENQLVSRVDVTKAICKYVKDKNLQIETDRRQFTPDKHLASLLKTDKPLTYYALQQQIQPHFIKDGPK